MVLDKGHSAATTADIARVAKVSIGSVYRYFPDKAAVMQAVVERNILCYLHRVHTEADRERFPDWWSAVAHAYDIYVDMCRADDSFRAVGGAGLSVGDPPELDVPLAEALSTVLIVRYGFPLSAALRVSMLQAVTIGEVMTRLAFRLHPDGHAGTLAQARRVARDILAAHAPATWAPGVESGSAASPRDRPPSNHGRSTPVKSAAWFRDRAVVRPATSSCAHPRIEECR